MNFLNRCGIGAGKMAGFLGDPGYISSTHLERGSHASPSPVPGDLVSPFGLHECWTHLRSRQNTHIHEIKIKEKKGSELMTNVQSGGPR